MEITKRTVNNLCCVDWIRIYLLFRFSAISRPKAVKLTYEERMKMKADLNETRSKEKEMWNVVNEKREV